jgi:hypothetical protein
MFLQGDLCKQTGTSGVPTAETIGTQSKEATSKLNHERQKAITSGSIHICFTHMQRPSVRILMRNTEGASHAF